MDIINKDSHEELISLSQVLSSLGAEGIQYHELYPLQEIFRAPSKPCIPLADPIDVSVIGDPKSEDGERRSKQRVNKRRRSMEYRVLMEKKRRQLIKDKVDILQEMTPNCGKSDLATKLESITEYMKYLRQQIQMLSMAYTSSGAYTSAYGDQGAWIPSYEATQWGYYNPLAVNVMTQQNISFNIPQYHNQPGGHTNIHRHQLYETPPSLIKLKFTT